MQDHQSPDSAKSQDAILTVDGGSFLGTILWHYYGPSVLESSYGTFHLTLCQGFKESKKGYLGFLY